ncbi:PAS domain-containing protein, partial [Salmonella enterica subsp. enterica serovar Anatum]|nr:PAS domain-containing protein [Salmonella enterica subsp. enterica serovar Anatum]
LEQQSSFLRSFLDASPDLVFYRNEDKEFSGCNRAMELLTGKSLKKENELYFIQGKVAVHTNGATQYVPLLSELMWDNAVWVHPQ